MMTVNGLFQEPHVEYIHTHFVSTVYFIVCFDFFFQFFGDEANDANNGMDFFWLCYFHFECRFFLLVASFDQNVTSHKYGYSPPTISIFPLSISFVVYNRIADIFRTSNIDW